MHLLVELDTCLSEKQKDEFLVWCEDSIDAKCNITKTVQEGLSCYKAHFEALSNYDYTKIICWEAANT